MLSLRSSSSSSSSSSSDELVLTWSQSDLGGDGEDDDDNNNDDQNAEYYVGEYNDNDGIELTIETHANRAEFPQQQQQLLQRQEIRQMVANAMQELQFNLDTKLEAERLNIETRMASERATIVALMDLERAELEERFRDLDHPPPHHHSYSSSSSPPPPYMDPMGALSHEDEEEEVIIFEAEDPTDVDEEDSHHHGNNNSNNETQERQPLLAPAKAVVHEMPSELDAKLQAQRAEWEWKLLSERAEQERSSLEERILQSQKLPQKLQQGGADSGSYNNNNGVPDIFVPPLYQRQPRAMAMNEDERGEFQLRIKKEILDQIRWEWTREQQQQATVLSCWNGDPAAATTTVAAMEQSIQKEVQLQLQQQQQHGIGRKIYPSSLVSSNDQQDQQLQQFQHQNVVVLLESERATMEERLKEEIQVQFQREWMAREHKLAQLQQERQQHQQQIEGNDGGRVMEGGTRRERPRRTSTSTGMGLPSVPYLRRPTTTHPHHQFSNEHETHLPDDTYSFLVCSNVHSWSFLFAMMVACTQFLLLSLLAGNRIDRHAVNPANIPANVEPTVRVTQILAIAIAVFVQDDLQVSLERIHDGYISLRHLGSATPSKWWFSLVLRSLQGAFGLTVAFFLIIQSDDVFDLLLNFTGVAFVSQLDNIAFEMAKKGFFGSAAQDSAESVYDKVYTISTTTGNDGKRAALLFVVAVIMYVGFIVVARKQASSEFLCQTIYAEFSDIVRPSLGTYTGRYILEDSIRHEGRTSYREDTEGSYLHTRRGRFAYCKTESVWTFSNQNDNGSNDDPCEDFLVRSAETTTFDLLKTGSLQWFAESGLLLQNIRLSCPQTDASPCGNSSRNARECREACPRISILGNEGFPDVEYQTSDFNILKNGMVETYDHPIFWGNSTSTALQLLMFAGRRWVLTDTSHFPEIVNATSDLEAIANFFSQGFHASQFPSPGAIAFISDAVDSVNDQLSPLGLRWYHAYYGNDEFPVADLTRPADAVFSCTVCHNTTNPCLYDGICPESGVCSCSHLTSGNLCEITPLDNGRCDQYFNTPKYGFDGGDCCGASCEGLACDVSTIPVFGKENCVGRGFPNCIDPSMVSIGIVVNGFDASVELSCDGKSHLSLVVQERCFDPPKPETVLVKDGTMCKLAFEDRRYAWRESSIEVYYQLGPDTTYLIAAAEYNDFGAGLPNFSFDFVVVARCLITGLADVVDMNVLSDDTSIQGQAVKWLDNYVSEGLICRSATLKQQYAMGVLSYANWFVPARHCEWRIVTCDAAGAVLRVSTENSIALERNRTSFTSEIGLLSNLAELQLSQYNLAGRISSWLGKLALLENLNLEQNDLTGQIPSELGLLTNLVSLNLQGNQIGQPLPTELGTLSSLASLRLEYNQLTGLIPTQLALLSNLKSIELTTNQLSGKIPTELGLLSKLEYIYLDDNRLTGPIPTEIGMLSSLVGLYVDGNLLTGSVPSEIGSLKNLTEFFLQGNQLAGPYPIELIALCASISCVINSPALGATPISSSNITSP